MASPFDFRALHQPPHHLPAEWSDTDQHIIESLLLPDAAPRVDLTLKRVDQFSYGKHSKGLAVPQPVSRTTPTGSGRSGRETPTKKKRTSRKRVTIEEKRMKHREVQRRFMQRKKVRARARLWSIVGSVQHPDLLRWLSCPAGERRSRLHR